MSYFTVAVWFALPIWCAEWWFGSSHGSLGSIIMLVLPSLAPSTAGMIILIYHPKEPLYSPREVSFASSDGCHLWVGYIHLWDSKHIILGDVHEVATISNMYWASFNNDGTVLSSPETVLLSPETIPLPALVFHYLRRTLMSESLSLITCKEHPQSCMACIIYHPVDSLFCMEHVSFVLLGWVYRYDGWCLGRLPCCGQFDAPLL